jgi:CMP-N-acetylneuraminic acid synthetase
VFEANHNGCLYIATGEKQMVSRRQDLPAAYFRDGALYLTKTKVIVEQQSLYGSTIGYVLGDQEHYVNLDTMQDWNKAEEMIQIIRKRT